MQSDTLDRLSALRRDRRIATAVFASKALGPAVVFLTYLWWVTR